MSTRPISNLSLTELHTRIKTIENDPEYQKYTHIKIPPYNDDFNLSTRVKGTVMSLLTAAVVIGGIATFVLSICAGANSMSLSQYFLSLFQNVNYIHCAIGGGVLLTLFTGAAIVMHRARTKREELLKDGENEKAPRRGAVCFMDENLVPIKTQRLDGGQEGKFSYQYLDLSTLKVGEGGKLSGKAYTFWRKTPLDHYNIATIVPFFVAPFYVIGAMILNVLRAVVIPLYVLGCCLYEIGRDPIYLKEGKFSPLDAGKEFLRSIWGIVKAPFFGLAYFMAGFYSLFNPMGGRKWLAAIERDWNDGAYLDKSIWCYNGRSSIWMRDGGFGPKSLGEMRFFVAGCQQPLKVVKVVNDKIISGTRIAAVLSPDSKEAGYRFYMQSKSEALKAVALCKEKDKLQVRYDALMKIKLAEEDKDKEAWLKKLNEKEQVLHS